MRTYNTGEKVFFRHPDHSWVCGVIKSCDKGGLICITNDEFRSDAQQNEEVNVSNFDDVEPLHMDALHDTPNDLLNLTALHEATLLRCLYMRFISDMVYTNIGVIVLSLNPFTFTIQRYQESAIKKYLSTGRSLDMSNFSPNLVPHSWAQAHITYYEMVDTRSNQCIIVTGESGAGKTENIKMVLNYLGIISTSSGAEKDRGETLCVGERLLACSPILECFGNAKTVNNDNSSRFGKFVKVKFNSKYLVVGAETNKYMLEKSRIVSAAKGERVYHSFYLLVKGRMSQELGLEQVQQYISLSSGDTIANSKYNTENDFDHVCTCMRNVGIKADEINSIWRVTAAVMTLLNVRFLPRGDGCSVDPETLPYIKKVVKLLDIDEAKIIHELVTSTKLLSGNQLVTKPIDVATAVDIRNAICKHLYDGLFSWLVERCNTLCDVESDGNWIGLLDIFGFENLRVNSFEQLCINLTNEYLQHNYNLDIFERDMEESKKEGVDMTTVKFSDNTGCLKMLTSLGGIFPLLDECSWLGNTDLMFLEKVVDNHSGNFFFKKDCVTRDAFCVRHYAADVTYNINGWIEKNRDILKDAVKLIVRSSGDSLVASCLPAPIPASEGHGRKAFTVGGLFCTQLTSLMDLINSTNPHWIRCIKPNPEKKPKLFHGKFIMDQLESSGVIGTVKIRKAGYPVRIPRDIFYQKYRVCTMLDSNVIEVILDVLKAAKVQIPSEAQVGRTKVFIKSHAYLALEHFRNVHLLETSVTLQRVTRGYLGRHELSRDFVARHKTYLPLFGCKKGMDDTRSEETRARQEVIVEEDIGWNMSRRGHDRQKKLQEAAFAKRERRRTAKIERSNIQDGRRCLEEDQRLAQLHYRAAVCIQRYVRGALTRIKLYRRLFEEHRAEWEYEREIASEKERNESRVMDQRRTDDERAWIRYLHSVDHLKRKMIRDDQRALENDVQKRRILIRELQRHEDKQRLKIETDESESRVVCTGHCQSLTAEMLKNEGGRCRSIEQTQFGSHRMTFMSEMIQKEEVHRRKGIEYRAERSAAADTRMKEALTAYALSRARLHDNQHKSQRLMPVGTRQPSSPNSSSAEELRFGEVQRRWLRQQELMDIAVLPRMHRESKSVGMEEVEDQYNGPYRVIEAPMQSIASMPQFPLQPSSLTRNTTEGRYNVREMHQWTPSSKGTIDWDSAFNS